MADRQISTEDIWGALT